MPSDAAPLIVRTLDILARGSATGTVVVTGTSRRGSIAMVAGRVAHVEAAGAAPLLGELLGIDREPTERAGWIGERTKREGLATAGEVLGAHREQMRARLVAMMSWRGVTVALSQGSPKLPPGVEPAFTADLLIEALRRAAREVPIERARERLAAHPWSLTALGRSLAARAALHADEAALVHALKSPTDLAALERIASTERAMRLAYALVFVEAAALPAEAGSMTLLARKTTELRRDAPAARLLDLPQHSTDTRAAMRKLVRELHPDRFAAHAPAAIQEASTAVVAAVTRAATRVR
jgi:hypothetical protein